MGVQVVTDSLIRHKVKTTGFSRPALATTNLKEAVVLFLECADPPEIAKRQHGEAYVTRFEASLILLCY